MTERQTEKETNIYTVTQIHRHQDKETHQRREKWTDRKTDKLVNFKTNILIRKAVSNTYIKIFDILF